MKKILIAMIVICMMAFATLTESLAGNPWIAPVKGKDVAVAAARAVGNWAKDPDTVRKGLDFGVSKVGTSNAAKDMWDKTDLLDPSDADAEPEYDPEDMPEVPTACGEEKDCWRCYEAANEKIVNLRYSFEKLRILHRKTDDYVKSALALGDGISGQAGVGALQWTSERLKIQKSFKVFEEAYRKKHKELLKNLKEALKEMAKCEEQYFGEKDWYARYGYTFHSFVAMHYQR